MGRIAIKMNEFFAYEGIEIFLDNSNRDSEVKTIRFGKADEEIFSDNIIRDFARATTFLDKMNEEIYLNDPSIDTFMEHHKEFKWYPYRFNRGEFSFIVTFTVRSDEDFRSAMAINDIYILPDGYAHVFVVKIRSDMKIVSYDKNVPIYGADKVKMTLYPSSDAEAEFLDGLYPCFSSDSNIVEVPGNLWMIRSATAYDKPFNWADLRQDLLAYIEERNDKQIRQKMKELSDAQQLSINLRNLRSHYSR